MEVLQKNEIKITTYGIITAISIFIGFSFISHLSIKKYIILITIFIISVYSQILLCKDCSSSYSLASHLTIIPILISIFFNCNDIRIIIFAFAIFCAISRIGCFFAGCCSGKISDSSIFTINYKNDYVINKQTDKTNVYVYPTIFIEIIIQFIIAFLVYYSKFGLILYGILNSFLIISTSFWRYKKRMSDNIYLPIISLLLFSYIVYKKECYSKINLNFIINPLGILLGIILAIIVSNDINHNNKSLYYNGN